MRSEGVEESVLDDFGQRRMDVEHVAGNVLGQLIELHRLDDRLDQRGGLRAEDVRTDDQQFADTSEGLIATGESASVEIIDNLTWNDLTPMVDAFRAEGIRVGFYYSLIDWHHPEFPVDKGHSAGSQYRRGDVVVQSDIDTLAGVSPEASKTNRNVKGPLESAILAYAKTKTHTYLVQGPVWYGAEPKHGMLRWFANIAVHQDGTHSRTRQANGQLARHEQAQRK